jgi:hypothetical protein
MSYDVFFRNFSLSILKKLSLDDDLCWREKQGGDIKPLRNSSRRLPVSLKVGIDLQQWLRVKYEAFASISDPTNNRGRWFPFFPLLFSLHEPALLASKDCHLDSHNSDILDDLQSKT